MVTNIYFWDIEDCAMCSNSLKFTVKGKSCERQLLRKKELQTGVPVDCIVILCFMDCFMRLSVQLKGLYFLCAILNTRTLFINMHDNY